jgi:hypothetical protein
MRLSTRIYLIFAGCLLICGGGIVMFTPYPEMVGVIAGVIAFITGGGLIAIALFHDDKDGASN